MNIAKIVFFKLDLGCFQIKVFRLKINKKKFFSKSLIISTKNEKKLDWVVWL